MVDGGGRSRLTHCHAFGFGLKPITKAMHAAGLIEADWPDGVADGMGAEGDEGTRGTLKAAAAG